MQSFWGCREKVNWFQALSFMWKQMSKGSSGIWSWAHTFSQAFPKSTFDELPQPSILPVPSGAEQCVLHGNVTRQGCNYWHCSNHGTMQNGSNSGEKRTSNQAGDSEQSHLRQHNHQALITRQVWGCCWKADYHTAQLQISSYWWTEERKPTWALWKGTKASTVQRGHTLGNKNNCRREGGLRTCEQLKISLRKSHTRLVHPSLNSTRVHLLGQNCPAQEPLLLKAFFFEQHSPKIPPNWVYQVHSLFLFLLFYSQLKSILRQVLRQIFPLSCVILFILYVYTVLISALKYQISSSKYPLETGILALDGNS